MIETGRQEDYGEMAATLADGARRLVADQADPRRVRALRRTLPGYDCKIAGTFAELGWFGILIPEEAGGSGLGLPEMAAVLRELEKGLISEPLLHRAVLAARLLLWCGATEHLAGLAAGHFRPALALDFDEGLPEVSAVSAERGWRLTGRCMAVPGGADASHFLVPSKTPDGWRLFLAPADASGLELTTMWRADDTPLGMLTLTGADLPQSSALTPPGVLERALARAWDETRIAASACLLGLSEKMLDMTVDYMGIRKQYDQLIGSFQALQHKAVDLYIEKERAAAVLGHALAAAADPDRLPLAALRAKGRCSEAATLIAREAIQLHGAIGYTEEHDLGLFMKRAMTLSAWLGNAGEQRRRFVDMGLALQ